MLSESHSQLVVTWINDSQMFLGRTGCSYHKHSSLIAAQGISNWIHVHVEENSRCQYSIVRMIVDVTGWTYSTAKIALTPA